MFATLKLAHQTWRGWNRWEANCLFVQIILLFFPTKHKQGVNCLFKRFFSLLIKLSITFLTPKQEGCLLRRSFLQFLTSQSWLSSFLQKETCNRRLTRNMSRNSFSFNMICYEEDQTHFMWDRTDNWSAPFSNLEHPPLQTETPLPQIRLQSWDRPGRPAGKEQIFRWWITKVFVSHSFCLFVCFQTRATNFNVSCWDFYRPTPLGHVFLFYY